MLYATHVNGSVCTIRLIVGTEPPGHLFQMFDIGLQEDHIASIEDVSKIFAVGSNNELVDHGQMR